MTDSIIWRATNGNLTADGASTANIVRFNEGSVNQNGYIYKSEFDVRISVPENERISEDLNAIQDMGMDGIDITLTGMIEESDSVTTDTKIVNLMTWLKEAKTDSDFAFGKFGLYLPDFPHFNCQPKNTGTPQYGYIIAGIRFIRDGEDVNKVGVIIQLRYAGDKSGLGTP